MSLLVTPPGFGRFNAGCLPVNLRLCIYYMPRLLELISGTGSIGKVFRARGWEVVSADCDAKMRPTIVADIGNFNYNMLGGYFDVVWCSPPVPSIRSHAATPKRHGTSWGLTCLCGDAET